MYANKLIPYRSTAELLTEQLQVALSQIMDMQGSGPASYVLQPSSDSISTIGNWKLEWGPLVKGPETDSGIPQNAVFVASSTDAAPAGQGIMGQKVYVVAIAATNPYSMIDWIVEDGLVDKVVDFTTFEPQDIQDADRPNDATTPYISKGTALGVKDIATLYPHKGALGVSETLVDFLSSIPADDAGTATLIFTGHSLAGALSPTLAAYLQRKGLLGKFGQVLVFPTAGATPGNGQFAGYFADNFKPVSTDLDAAYASWNVMHWNHLDVVPHAWATAPSSPANMTQIESLYGAPGSLLAPQLEVIVGKAEGRANSSGITYTMLPNQPFTNSTVVGQIPPYDPNGKELDMPLNGLPAFLQELGWQHVGAYSHAYLNGNEEVKLILPGPIENQPGYKLLPGVTYMSPESEIEAIVDYILHHLL